MTSSFAKSVLRTLLTGMSALFLASCGGSSGPAPVTISGSLSGLLSGQSITLINNGNLLTVPQNGSFTFTQPVAAGGSYNVNVLEHPADQICSIANGTGAAVNGKVTSVQAVCVTNTYPVVGNVLGLNPGQTVTLLDNGGDPITVAAAGVFAFPTRVASRGSYAVTVGGQSAGPTCSVANNGTGVMTSTYSEPNYVLITCFPYDYYVSGTLQGLASETSVTLTNNGRDPIPLTRNGKFTWPISVGLYGSSYRVEIGAQPFRQVCSLSGGAGTVSGPIPDMMVNCVDDH